MQQITEPYDRKPKPKEALTNIGASVWSAFLETDLAPGSGDL